MHAGLLERKTAKEEAANQVGLRAPAPILCTYMARRAPAFVRNKVLARHINIAHGLYPRAPLSNAELRAVLAYLRSHTSTTGGRTYAAD